MNLEKDPKATTAPLKSLTEWTQVLCKKEMPIFSNTALRIHHVLNDERKGAMELASVILQDPNLTVKLLKISNSSNYNLSHYKIVTVSRAIIMLGYDVIRELTLVCSFFESILSAINLRQVNEEITQAIQAAVHAKSIAIATNDSSSEEVFIAALLNRIGSICFWCYCGEQGEQIQTLINEGEFSREEAEREVLGFKLTELGVCLSKAWELGGLIEESIKPNGLFKNHRVGFVQLGYEIAEALKKGTGSDEYKACIRKIEALTKQSRKVIAENLQNNIKTAAELAFQFGATDAAKLIKGSLDQLPEPEPIIDKKLLQLQISQDITSILSDQIDVNQLLGMVLEGIHRSIGMDRTMFSMLVADKQCLRESLSLGWRKEILHHKIIFNIRETPPNLFFHAMAGIQALWTKPSDNDKYYTFQDINVIGKNECFLMPVFSNKTPIGLIYADRGISSQPLKKEDFETFKYFAQLANIGLTLYHLQRTKTQ